MDALLVDYRTASAQDMQTQAAIAGALLANRTDQTFFLALWRSAWPSTRTSAG